MSRMIDTRCLFLGILALIAVVAERQDVRRSVDPIETGTIRRVVHENHGRLPAIDAIDCLAGRDRG